MGFCALMVWLGARASVAARERVGRLATALGLQLEAAQPTLGFFYPEPRVTGRLRGKAVLIHNYSTGSGKSRRTWSALAVTPAQDGGLTLVLTRQGFVSKLQELFGSKEITVGNPEFDAAWFVRTNAPDFLQAALLPELQAKFRPFKGAFKLEKGVVTYVEEGAFNHEERCQRFLLAADVACDLADIAEVYAQQTGRSA